MKRIIIAGILLTSCISPALLEHKPSKWRVDEHQTMLDKCAISCQYGMRHYDPSVGICACNIPPYAAGSQPDASKAD